MVNRVFLVDYLDKLLEIEKFQDYAPNGLQCEGKLKIKRLVTGVTASLELIEKAIAWQADAILVHHGYFWRGEDAKICGVKKQRLTHLLSNNINLLAYHLPLDAHAIYGNNIQLAKLFNWQILGDMNLAIGKGIGLYGEFIKALNHTELAIYLQQKLQRKALIIAGHNRKIKTIAWISGAAQNEITTAAKFGVDAFLTGEYSEYNYHLAKELAITFISAGHHATERYGVKSLGNHLAINFNLKHQFIEIANPL